MRSLPASAVLLAPVGGQPRDAAVVWSQAGQDCGPIPSSGSGEPQAGSANGTTYEQRANRITLGSSVFAYGAPRVFEGGMRITF